MRIIKRSGEEVEFDASKIEAAIIKANESVYIQYFDTLEKEYSFWMEGAEKLENHSSYKRVIKTKNVFLLNIIRKNL